MTWMARRAVALADRLGGGGEILQGLTEGPEAPPLSHPGFAHAAHVYGLSAWELQLLALAFAVELDRRFGDFVALQQAGARIPRAELALQMANLDLAQRPSALSALLPEGRLRRFGLLQPSPPSPLVDTELRLEPQLWPHLVGLSHVTPRVPLQTPNTTLETLSLRDTTRASLNATVQQVRTQGGPFLVMLVGPAGQGRQGIAQAMLGELGIPFFSVRGTDLDQGVVDRTALLRDARWFAAAVLLEGPVHDIGALLTALDVPIIWVVEPHDPRPLRLPDARGVATVHCPRLNAAERVGVWRHLLGADADQVDVPHLSRTFRLRPARVQEAIRRATQMQSHLDPTVLHQACDDVTAAAFADLAQRLDLRPGWSDLIVSDTVREELDLAVAWMRRGPHVFDAWGLARTLGGSTGLVALFAGPPGTGKTLAARVLAQELGYALWRVDLSRTVNKYIGETEKNLGRLFDAASEGRVMLFFDEAEALFGKRTEVRDAHDRYANLETGYLLQRLEEHDGPVVMASNLPRNLDDAFQRRIHVIARFELPNREQRRRIWDLHLPPAPYRGQDLELDELAHHECAGGDIRNATVTAALLAAHHGETVSMKHAVRALARELRKSGRMVQPKAFKRWM